MDNKHLKEINRVWDVTRLLDNIQRVVKEVNLYPEIKDLRYKSDDIATDIEIIATPKGKGFFNLKYSIYIQDDYHVHVLKKSIEKISFDNNIHSTLTIRGKETHIYISTYGFFASVNTYVLSDIFKSTVNVSFEDCDAFYRISLVPNSNLTENNIKHVWSLCRKTEGEFNELKKLLNNRFKEDFTIYDNPASPLGYSLESYYYATIDTLTQGEKEGCKVILKYCLSKIKFPIHRIRVLFNRVQDGLFVQQLPTEKYNGEFEVMICLTDTATLSW